MTITLLILLSFPPIDTSTELGGKTKKNGKSCTEATIAKTVEILSEGIYNYMTDAATDPACTDSKAKNKCLKENGGSIDPAGFLASLAPTPAPAASSAPGLVALAGISLAATSMLA